MKQEITTSGGTYVVTFTQAGTVEADRNNRTYILATATGEGQVAFKAISDSVIISDDNAILTAEDFVFAPGPILKPTSGGGGSTVNNWITVNDAGEAVLDFPAESSELLELLSIGASRFTKITGNAGGKTNCKRLLYSLNESLLSVDIDLPAAESIDEILANCINITSFSVRAPKATSGKSAFNNIYKTKSARVEYPEMIDASGMFNYLPALKDCYFSLPKCTNAQGAFSATAVYITTFSFNLASLATIALAPFSGAGALGNFTTLQNVTVLEGGLASCTSFIITNSTNLTDESIQNIIDALPDYSGTETSALVSFPPDRLTAEQQAQLAAKNWTWS